MSLHKKAKAQRYSNSAGTYSARNGMQKSAEFVDAVCREG